MGTYQVQLVQSQILLLIVILCLLTNCSHSSTLTNQQPVPLRPSPDDGCPDSSCSFQAEYCNCDHSCLLYGDCCHDANVLATEKSARDQQFSCVGSGFDTYWMITSCSRSWITDQLADGVANVSEIVSLCDDPTITRASYKIVLPPVTDGSTGLVYRDVFCAQCNGVQQSNWISWTMRFHCSNVDNEQPNFTINELLQNCSFVKYKFQTPISLSNPRGCKCLPTRLITTCPEDSPMNLREKCTTFGLNLVTYDGSVYANTYCAACWNVSSQQLVCLEKNETVPTNELLYLSTFCRPPFDDVVRPPIERVSIALATMPKIPLLVDVYGIEDLISTSMYFNRMEEVCLSGSVYDAFRGSCHTLLPANCTNSTAITLARGSYSLISNESVFWNSYNLNVSIESVDDNGRPLVCIPSVQSTNCVPVILESSEYVQQENGSSTFNLVWLFNNETYSIEGTDKNGRPLICTNLTQNFTRNSTNIVTVFSYLIVFDILSYIGISVDFVSCLLFLVTFFLFKDLRTFFSKLMVNFILSILLGDALFLVGHSLFKYVRVDILCSIFAVATHYMYLCRFSWMTVMGAELVRSFANIRKLNKSDAVNWKLLTLYMLLGWLSPLVIVIPTIIVNFTVEDSVNYGVRSSCWINQPIALIVTFVVPVGLSVIFNVFAFIVVMVILAHIRYRPMASSHDTKEQKKQSWKDFRFAIALLTVTGLSCSFGFLALFSRDLAWAWYLFIIFNMTQAVTVLVAFLFTKKVFHLYWSLLCCLRTKRP